MFWVHLCSTVKARKSLRQANNSFQLSDGDPVRSLRSRLSVSRSKAYVCIDDFFLCFGSHFWFDCSRIPDVSLEFFQRVIHIDGGLTPLVQAHDMSSQCVIMELIWFVNHNVYQIET